MSNTKVKLISGGTTTLKTSKSGPVVLGSSTHITTVGPFWARGPAGAGDGNEIFLVANRLSELTTQQDKAVARSNLGLETLDGGTFN